MLRFDDLVAWQPALLEGAPCRMYRALVEEEYRMFQPQEEVLVYQEIVADQPQRWELVGAALVLLECSPLRWGERLQRLQGLVDIYPLASIAFHQGPHNRH
jgi:hypothetical protein